MGFGFKQPLVGKKGCVTTLITAAEETKVKPVGTCALKVMNPKFCECCGGCGQ